MPNKHFCQGPHCHEQTTQDRFLKSRGVIRGRYAYSTLDSQGGYWSADSDKYFCSNSCYNDFAHKHIRDIVAIAPRTEALETPILDPKRTTNTYHYGMDNQYSYDRTETKIEVDNTRTNSVG